MDKKIVVACDLDDVTYDLVGNLMPLYNEKYKDNVKFEDIKSWNIHSFLNPKCENIFKEFVNEKFFENLEIPYLYVRALSELNNKYDLYFVSSGHPKTAPFRDKLLSKFLPWYETKQLVLIADKSKFKCDYLIDDCYSNVRKGDYTGILIDKPWNKNEIYPDWLRASDLYEAVECIGRNLRLREIEL